MSIQDPINHTHSTQAKIYEEQIVGEKVITINISIYIYVGKRGRKTK